MKEREEPFKIVYHVGRSPYTLDIYPEWDEEDQETGYIVSMNGEDIGILKKSLSGAWQWADGGIEGVIVDGMKRNPDTAAEIGSRIDESTKQ